MIPNCGPWITDFEKDIVNKAMSDWYDKPYYYCELFEAEFAKYHNRKYALMTPNCTSAIHLLLAGLGISDNDEVIVPECTWIASAAPLFYQRAKPVFCDIDADDWCLSPQSAEAAITPKTKAIIAVGLFGNMAKMDELQEIAKKHNLYLIEDAAESLGSKYKGIRAGKFGIGSVFSFHRTKTLTTGEGGMLLLDDDELFEKCKILRDHGRKMGDPAYFNREIGFKYMPNNILAALGYAQFLRLDELVSKKHWILEEYRNLLADVDGLQFNAEPEHIYNSAWITSMVVDSKYGLEKNELIDKLIAKGIGARPFFYPLSSIPAIVKAGYDTELHKKKNPNSYDISNRGLNLPSPLNMTQEEIIFAVNAIKDILKERI